MHKLCCCCSCMQLVLLLLQLLLLLLYSCCCCCCCCCWIQWSSIFSQFKLSPICSHSAEWSQINCDKVKIIWQDLLKWIKTNGSGLNVELSICNVIFGIIDKGSPSRDLVDYIILCTKYFIHKCRLDKNVPNFNNIINYISWKYRVEKYAFSLNCQFEKFVQKCMETPLKQFEIEICTILLLCLYDCN